MAHADGSDDASSSRPFAALTVREYLVLAASAAGLSVHEVAAELRDNPDAVRRSLASATAKLGARSKLEAVTITLRHGLIEIPRDHA